MTRVLYDISDFMHFFLSRAHPTGIQRVQIDVLAQLLATRDDVIPVFFSSAIGRYCPVDIKRVFARDRKYIRRMNPGQRNIGRKLRSLFFVWGKGIEPSSQDIVFVSGSAPHNSDRNKYLAGKAKSGLSVVWTCYDLIPIRYPEFTGNGLQAKNEFKTWLDQAIDTGGKFICISQFVAEDLKAYAVEVGKTANAVAVPLAHEFTPDAGLVGGNVAQLGYEKFVLFVSSLSIRKNQFGLVKLWMKLYRELDEELPTLVLVGMSWGMERLFKILDGTGYLNGKVLHLSEVSDAELFYLYSRCEFTIFPSFHEGWGLPVGESLWMGKPCLSSNATSLPEVGQDFVTYFDPMEANAMEAVVRKALKGEFDRYPPSRDRLRTWHDVAVDVAAEIEKVGSQ